MVAVLPSRVVAICSPPGVCVMTTVVGPMGSACIADSDRDRSIDQVPEKSGRPCACAVSGRASETTSSADRTFVITALLDGRSIALATVARPKPSGDRASARVGLGVLPSIGLGPGGEALPKARRTLFLAGDAVLLVGI